MKKTLFMVVMMALVLMAGTAFAVDSTTIEVSATVLSGCTIQSGAPMTLAFGTVDPTIFTDTTLSASLIFRCTNGVGYTVQVDGAAQAAGTAISRNMDDGTGNLLAYTLTPQSAPAGISAGSTVDITYTVNATLTAAEVLANGIGGTTYSETIALDIIP